MRSRTKMNRKTRAVKNNLSEKRYSHTDADGVRAAGAAVTD